LGSGTRVVTDAAEAAFAEHARTRAAIRIVCIGEHVRRAARLALAAGGAAAALQVRERVAELFA
jgi:hypothetical protein